MIRTRTPRRASWFASISPVGPAPTTRTSVSIGRAPFLRLGRPLEPLEEPLDGRPSRGHRRIPPPQGATCGSGETGGTRGNPRRRPAARRARGRSGALWVAATGPARQRDRPDRASGAAVVAPRVATHPVRDRPAATTRAAG